MPLIRQLILSPSNQFTTDKTTAVSLIGTILTVVKGALHGLMFFASTVFGDFLEIRIVKFETTEANMS